MKFCPKCNAHYENDTFFCLNDGTPLKQTEAPVKKDIYPAENPENITEETLVLSSGSDEIKTVEPLDEIDNKSEETFIKPSSKDSEVTVIREQENKSEPTIIRPQQKDSEVTFIRPQQKQGKEKTSNKPPLKDEMFALQTGVSSTKSDRNYMIKTAGLGALILFIVVGLCGGIAFFENQSRLSSEDKLPDSSAQTEPTETPPETATIEFPTNSDNAGSSETPEEITRPTPLPAENTTDDEDKSDADSSFKEGKISGKLIYPSEEIPVNMHLCLVNTKTTETYCSDEQNGKDFFDVNRSKATYTAYATPGIYYIYAKISGKKERAYYTEFVPCGMSTKCRSHKKIPISIKAGQTVRGIAVGDWYDF